MKDKNVIVHVKNEQEWDIIKKECSSNSAMFNKTWNSREYTNLDVGIWIQDNSYCSLKYFKENCPKTSIISFEEYQTGYIVGKWYKFSAIGPGYYAKFSHIFSDRKPEVKDFWFNECINNGEYCKKDDWWSESHKPTLVTDLSEIQEFLPNGHEDKKDVEYKFPEKWCIRQNASQKACDWYNKQKSCNIAYLNGNHKYITSANSLSDSIFEGYTEITAEQFEKYVLKPIEIIKPWSIGTYGVVINNPNHTYDFKLGDIDKIKDESSNKSYVWFEKFSSYKPENLKYSMGLEFKWFATLEEAEKFSKTLTKKEEVKEFKKGEYIVTLNDSPDRGASAKKNYCFKQRKDHSYLQNEIDASGSRNNGNTGVTPLTNNWRYATKEEAAEYERIGKPYDVTILNNYLLVNGEYYFVKEGVWEWIMKCLDNTLVENLSFGQFNIKLGHHIRLDSEYLGKEKSICYKDAYRTYRKATQEEIDWLDACIKANKFVEKPFTHQNFCIGGTDILFKEGSNTIHLSIDNVHPSNEGFQSLSRYIANNLPNSISVKVRTKKPETQTVSKRVKLNFQINQPKLTIKLRNSHGNN